MKPHLVRLFTPQELNHSSYVQTGLFELEQAGFIRTQVVFCVLKRMGTLWVTPQGVEERNQPHPKTSFYELEDATTGKVIRFATDLYDAADSFSLYALTHCDYVFKRNYQSQFVSHLPKEFQAKLLPLGLTFGVFSPYRHSQSLFFRGLLWSNLRLQFKIDRLFFHRLVTTYSQQMAHWKFVQTSRSLSHFAIPERGSESTILFQTRCFLHEDNPDLKAVHQDRYRIIQLMREKFPLQFRGGFVPSPFVMAHYPDAVTSLKTDPQSYLELVKKARIVIYTRGIQDSPAWKMAEYLSQGKVILAERMSTELPVPLEHGKHVLFFNSIAEIPLLCEHVLEDTALCERLSQNARAYYETVISPPLNIKRLLQIMLENPKP
ncbi:glycosyltransferase [Flavobacterium sp.]|uniref:glycosyltransferase n=1 Tax=Flavobacterium sp. TaxID=239 RepID=UPI002FD9918E